VQKIGGKIMKKRLLSGMAAAMMVLSLAACAGNQDADSQTAQTDENITVTRSEGTLTAADYKQYMTLGDYKNIEVGISADDYQITDDDVQAEIDSCLKSAAVTEQVTEGVVADGDSINLDFKGLLDGVAFSGGTATDYSYTIGGGFIDDLDRGLIGLEIGKEYEIPCRFPDDYGEETLNGKDVIFVVTVNYVESLTYPEYNDEFVQELTADTESPLNTTAELETYIREYLEESAQSAYDNAVFSAVMSSLINEAQITERPQKEVDAASQMISDNAEYEATYYGYDSLESYMTGVYGYASMEDFEADVLEYAEEYVDQKMVIYLVADSEGISVTEDDMIEYAKELVEQTTYSSLSELIEDYGAESFWDDVEYQLLYDRTSQVLLSYAKAN
jgi:trigger factor